MYLTRKKYFLVHERKCDTGNAKKTLGILRRYHDTLVKTFERQYLSFVMRCDTPFLGQYSNYVFTKDKYERVTESSPMFAIDCEMVSKIWRFHKKNSNLFFL